MKQILKLRIQSSLQSLEEAGFKTEECFKKNKIDASTFFPFIHFLNELISNTILFDTNFKINAEIELRIYLNSSIICIVESGSFYTESPYFNLKEGTVNSELLKNKLEKLEFRQKNNKSIVLLQSKNLDSFRSFSN